ncbi:MAG TPA: hypothetical protein PLN56_02135 [Methanoregulaceae archaeon]|nr:MAG: hypothetical protein IPI71_02295 [Methanolinea sp.]HON81348.1 hypothetical protein [Methanoregulaceae archaeon]HPD09788.1 hypothetical protein [Methanoregulaceae archaeon]HRT14491.1 hypothetical protein [Methanoregulaceae archaeon]HRU30062.1 hypothetical protein [Methanoregulaceae archaeon]
MFPGRITREDITPRAGTPWTPPGPAGPIANGPVIDFGVDTVSIDEKSSVKRRKGEREEAGVAVPGPESAG